MVTIHADTVQATKVHNSTPPVFKSLDMLREQYPDRFEGLGQFQTLSKLVINPDVPPVRHAPRRAPIQLHVRDKIKQGWIAWLS